MNNTVLIIDDDATLRLLAKNILETQGFKVITLGDAETAIEQINVINPDVVLLDVSLPGMDGFTACRTLRQIPRLKHLPIMMLTGQNDVDSIKHAYESDATLFDSKPINWINLAHQIMYIIRANHNLTELHKIQHRLENAKKIAQIADWECQNVVRNVTWSNELKELLGLPNDTQVQSHNELFQFIHPEDQELVQAAHCQLFIENNPYDIEYRIKPLKGDIIFVHEKASIIPDLDSDGSSYIGTVQDITLRKQAEEKIRQMAYFDNLTGLSNRTLFDFNLKNAIQVAQRKNTKLALLFIDLDNFKKINDSMGHEAGDILLKEMSKRLHKSLRGADLIARLHEETYLPVARFGGDEFMALLTDNASINVIQIVAQRILNNLTVPVEIEGNQVTVSASIGIAFYPDDGDESKILLKNADTAMYYAKQSGRNNYCYYDRGMNAFLANNFIEKKDPR